MTPHFCDWLQKLREFASAYETSIRHRSHWLQKYELYWLNFENVWRMVEMKITPRLQSTFLFHKRYVGDTGRGRSENRGLTMKQKLAEMRCRHCCNCPSDVDEAGYRDDIWLYRSIKSVSLSFQYFAILSRVSTEAINAFLSKKNTFQHPMTPQNIF